jgi:Lon protease-like protein
LRHTIESIDSTLIHRPYTKFYAAQVAFMSEDGEATAKSVSAVLGKHPSVRDLVRLLQCHQCSLPFNNPVTLPCGNSLCRSCLPESYEREHISYPDLPGRREGFQCPFEECGQEHTIGDCNVDVTLSKIMSGIADAVAKLALSPQEGPKTIVEEQIDQDDRHDVVAEADQERLQISMSGGTMLATYTLAAQGQLAYQMDLKFSWSPEDDAAINKLDTTAVVEVLGAAQKEVECQVCYAIMLNPVTTSCGHTLCRVCLTRVLDHTQHCPICRRQLALAPSLAGQASNKTLVTMLARSWPEAIAARIEAVAAEERDVYGQTFPLFVCTLGFPNQPTYLRIFEPRYRLMLRRCMEGSRQFGLVMYNRYSEPQGELGNVHFYHYGTMVRITEAQSSMSGVSMVELQGQYRFRVTSHSLVDGYSVGTVERVDDVDVAEEERIEAEETSAPPDENEDPNTPSIDHMSTQDLLALVKDFIARNQARSTGWLQQNVLDVHGQPPDDAAAFPWWFASVVPLIDEEKYKLLPTRTVRERLKIVAQWVRRIEAQRW